MLSCKPEDFPLATVHLILDRAVCLSSCRRSTVRLPAQDKETQQSLYSEAQGLTGTGQILAIIFVTM